MKVINLGYCTGCGETLANGWAYCGRCGEPVASRTQGAWPGTADAGYPPEPAGASVWVSTIAGLLLLAGVGLGVAALFPPFYATGGSLASNNANLLLNCVIFAGWTLAALLILVRQVGAGAMLGAAVSLSSLGFYGANTASVARYGTDTAATGFWLGQANWLACTAGAVVALVALGWAGGLGAVRRGYLAPPLLAAIGGIAAAVAYAPGWERYRLTSTTSGLSGRYFTNANAFHGPGAIIAANVVVIAVLVIAPVVAVLWCPISLAVAALAGVVIPQAANVAGGLVTNTSPADPRSVGLTTARLAQLKEGLSVGSTPWFWAEAGAIGLLAVTCLLRLLVGDRETSF